MMKLHSVVFFIIVINLTMQNACAQDINDKDQLFSDTNIILNSSKNIDSLSLIEKANSKPIVISGSIESEVQIDFKENYFVPTAYTAYLAGNLLLNVKLLANIEAFGNFEVQYLIESLKATFEIQELFVDANFIEKIYFRTGKLALQWGKCYFWNPTDMINVERGKSIIPSNDYSEDTYGAIVHVPFSTMYNFYGFIAINNINENGFGVAYRTEVSFGSTEIGAAILQKKKMEPIYGIDFSTSFFNIVIKGGISIESGKNFTAIKGLQESESLLNFLERSLTDSSINLESPIGSKVVSKTCLGFSKSFDLLDVKNRIELGAEVYLNSAGVKGNFFKMHNVIQTLDSILKITSESDSVSQKLLVMQPVLLERLAKPNDFSTFYISFFASVDEFIISTMILHFSAVMNIDQKAINLSTGLQYLMMDNLSTSLVVNGILGGMNNEYTIFQSQLTTLINLQVEF